MTHFKFVALLVCLTVASNALAQTASTAQPNYGNNDKAGHYATLNGVKLYYEEYGKGQPLVLIHGNGGNIAYMSPQIEYFSKNYRVIAIDCRGRGKSELGKDSLTYTQMAKDLNDLLDKLNVDSAYMVGRSDGAIVALLMAIDYPKKAKKIVAFAANLTPDTTALFPNVYEEILQKRRHADSMLAIHDPTQNWHLLQQRNRMMEFQPHITVDELHKITCPTLVASGDRDDIKEEHTLLIFKNIGNANLCFFPNETHRVTKQNPDLFNAMVEKFFTEAPKKRGT